MSFAFLNWLIVAVVYHAQAQQNLGTGGTSALGQMMNAGIDGNGAAMKQVATAAVAEVPLATGEFVEGFIAAYFNKTSLAPGEKKCIEQEAEEATEAFVSLIETIAQLIGQLVAHETPNAMLGMMAMGQVLAVTESTAVLVRKCLQEDALVVWNQTISNLKNPQYVQGRFLANGLDMARVVADAIPAWSTGQLEKVGADFGTLMRKILLSTNTGTTAMTIPEGMTQEQVGTMVATGTIEGLFPYGSKVTITNKVDTTKTFEVDLHQCVAMEAEYFTKAINGVYIAITQLATSIEEMQLHQNGVSTHGVGTVTANQHGKDGVVVANNIFAGATLGNLNWMNDLQGLMVNLPTLMDRCGFEEADRVLMSDALKDMNSVTLAFTVPGPPDRAGAAAAAATKFEQAEEDWKAGRYKQFGQHFGDLMRDLLLTIYPHPGPTTGTRLYSADHGHLRLGDVVHNPVAALTVFVGGFAAIMLFALVLVRVAGRRTDSAQAAGRAWLETEADLECEAEPVE